MTRIICARLICPRPLTRFAVLLVMGVCLFWPLTTRAEEIVVDTTVDFDVDDNDNCTLTEAILAANLNAAQDSCPAGDDTPVDIIVLATDAVYGLPVAFSGDTGLPSIAGTVVISGNHATLERNSATLFRLLHIAPSSGNLTLAQVTLRFGNTLAEGGAIYNQGTLSVLESQIVSNTAGSGGGIANNAATLTISATNILSNTAEEGGGIYNGQGSRVTLNNSDLIANRATASGGGLRNYALSIAVVTNSDIVSNTAADHGGGLYNDGTVVLTGTNVIANGAGLRGGGLYHQAGEWSIFHSRLLANGALDRGAAIYQESDAGVIDQSCIVGNQTVALVNDDDDTLDATHNWWGAPDGPSGAGPGAGDSVGSDVDYAQFLTSATLGCPSRMVDLGFSKRVTPTGDLLPGQPVTYTLTISNQGEADIYELFVNDNLPSGFQLLQTITAGFTFTINGSGGGFRIPILSGGEVGTLHYIGRVDLALDADQVLTNTGVISHVVKGILNASVSSKVVVPKLTWQAATLRVLEGSGDFTATVVLSPTTPYESVSATAVTTDSIGDSNSSIYAATGVTALEFPPNSSSQPVTVSVTEDDSRAPHTIALVLHTPINGALGDPYTATLIVTDTDFLGIAVDFRVEPNEARASEWITYTYRVTNTGSVALASVEIEDERMSGSLPLSPLTPNQSLTGTIAYQVRFADLPGPLEDEAVATGIDSEGDSISASDSATVTLRQYETSLPNLLRQVASE